jgi:hypothetical protein
LRKPNFFIVGAPKAGTTSLAAWLSEHPEIFLSEVKEPHFFNTDDRRGISSIEAYEELFRKASERRRSIGEASVWYLSSADAVQNILSYQPEARFVVMLRNPIEMAPALHGEMVLSGHENVLDFRTAWDLQNERRVGRNLPPMSWAKRRLLYGEACLLGAQLERLLSQVKLSNVICIFLDDLAANPRKEYQRVLHFLGVQEDGRQYFPIYNASKTIRWPHLTRLIFVLLELKNKIGLNFHLGIWRRFSAHNAMEKERATISPETATMLAEYFRSDIELLGRLLGKNLHHWVANPRPTELASRRPTSIAVGQ